MEDPLAASSLCAGLVLFFLGSAFFSIVKVVFSSMKMNSFSLENPRLRHYADKIEKIHEHRDILAATISVGKSIATIGFSFFCLVCMDQLFPELSFPAVFVSSFAGAFIILTLPGYFLPRAVALRYYVELVPMVLQVFLFISYILKPLVLPLLWSYRLLLSIVNYDEKFFFLTEEERSRMKDTDEHEEGLDEEGKEMIHSIFELGETTVKEIMVPRIDVKGLDIQTNFSTTLKTVSSWGHSRIPVYEENIDSIIGILYAKDLLEWVERPSPQEWALSSMIKKPHFVPLGKPVDEMLKEFKQKHIHIAIVVDEYGGTAGLVTMEDILEEIVGEIHDEYDTEINPIVKTGDSTYLIDPHLDLHDLTEELNIALDVDDAEYNTLSGLIYHEYGDIPQKNTEFNYKGLHIKVMEMDNQRIEKVQVSLGNHHSAIKDRKN